MCVASRASKRLLYGRLRYARGIVIVKKILMVFYYVDPPEYR
jgi:hypothetical protein